MLKFLWINKDFCDYYEKYAPRSDAAFCKTNSNVNENV